MSDTATKMTFEAPVPERHRVLIAAAVAAVVGPGARILGIMPASAEPAAWTRSGRAAIHGSHNWSRGSSAIRSLASSGPGAMK